MHTPRFIPIEGKKQYTEEYALAWPDYVQKRQKGAGIITLCPECDSGVYSLQRWCSFCLFPYGDLKKIKRLKLPLYAKN